MRQVELGDPSSGIGMQFTRSRLALSVFGWYDHYVGIQGHEKTLAEWCRLLEISAADLRKVAKQLEEQPPGGPPGASSGGRMG